MESEQHEPEIDPWAEGSQQEDAQPRFHFRTGGSFILDAPPTARAVWGAGDDVLAAAGEATMLAGIQGTGKSTIGQQFALGRCGFPEYAELLGLPIAPGQGRTLYLAMDRPRQIARSFRRMVGDAWREELDQKLVVWSGPPPWDLAKRPTVLRDMALEAEADTVIVDSLKDAFIGLNDDESAAAYNRARQATLVAGVELLELHHGRKSVNGTERKRLSIDDVYGSTWLTSGAGSVFILSGQPGDPIVDMNHVKQPMAEVGPFKLLHDHDAGQTTLHNPTDLVELARSAKGITVSMAAQALAGGSKVDPAATEKARRKLKRLENSGLLKLSQEADPQSNQAAIWRAV